MRAPRFVALVICLICICYGDLEWPVRVRRVAVISTEWKSVKPLCDTPVLRSVLFEAPYPYSLASIIERESFGTERITGDVYTHLSLGTEAFLGPGCNYYAYVTAAEDAAMAARVPLHLYSHHIYIVPPSSDVNDRCDWSRLAEQQCNERPLEPCRMLVRSCADASVYARLWGINRGIPRLGTLGGDRGPLAVNGDPLGLWNNCKGTGSSCHYVAPQLVAMGYIAPWRLTTVSRKEDSLSTLVALGSLNLHPASLPPNVYHVVRIVHPITNVPYFVSTRPRSDGPIVAVHSLASRGGLSLLVGYIAPNAPDFVDFASEFSIAVVSQHAEGCVVRITFGCYITPPTWSLVTPNPPVGIIDDLVVIRRNHLGFKLMSGAQGTCGASALKLKLSSDVWDSSHFSLLDRTQSGNGEFSLTLQPGQACLGDVYFGRKAGLEPPFVDTRPLLNVSVEQHGFTQNASFVLADVGTSCLESMGSFFVDQASLVFSADFSSLLLLVNVSSLRPQYCKSAGDVVVVVDTLCGRIRSVVDDSKGQASARVEIMRRCYDGATINVTITRSFGKSGEKTFARKGMLRDVTSCENPVHAVSVSLQGALSWNTTENGDVVAYVRDGERYTCSFEVTQRACDVGLWEWILAQQLRQVYKEGDDLFQPSASEYFGSARGRSLSWQLKSSSTSDVLMDGAVSIAESMDAHFVLRASLSDAGEVFLVKNNTQTVSKINVKVERVAAPCARNVPSIWAWCQGDSIRGANLYCYTQIFNADERCEWSLFEISWFAVNASQNWGFEVSDFFLPNLQGDPFRVYLGPSGRRTWIVSIPLPATNKPRYYAGFGAKITRVGTTESANDTSGQILIENCMGSEIQMIGAVANRLERVVVIPFRQTASVSFSLVNPAEIPCAVLVQPMVEFPARTLWNSTGLSNVYVGGSPVSMSLSLTPWSVPQVGETYDVIVTVAGNVFVAKVTVAADRCVPGPLEVTLDPCPFVSHQPDTSGVSKFCGKIVSKDVGASCAPVQWAAGMQWIVPNPDQAHIYLDGSEQINRHFTASSDLFSGFALKAGESRSFTLDIAHSDGVAPGYYHHELLFSHPNDGNLSHTVPYVNASVHIACPRPSVVSQISVEQDTPIFHPAVAVTLKWNKLCTGLCCELRFAVFRDDVLLADGLFDTYFIDYMRPYGQRNFYRIEAMDGQGRRSPGPNETCDDPLLVVVEFPNLLSFFLLLGGVLAFVALSILIVILIIKTRKIDMEIGRLQKVAEMHELANIEGSADVVEMTIPQSPAGGEDMQEYVLVKALEDYPGSGPDELAFSKGDVIRVLRKNKKTGWWRGELNGSTGLFPQRLTRVLPQPLPIHSPVKRRETFEL